MNAIALSRFRPDRIDGGAALRNCQNIRALAAFGAVDVVSVGVDEAPAPALGCVRDWTPFALDGTSRTERIRHRCWVLRPDAYPTVDRFHSERVRRWLTDRIARCQYDVALVEGIALAPYVADLARAGCRVVFDAHNVESVLHGAVLRGRRRRTRVIRRMKDALLQRRLEAVERRAVAGADVLWACSEQDALALQRAYRPRAPITVVPNGVDVPAYRRDGVPPATGDWRHLPITLVYVGLFSYSPNEDAALRLIREVLPSVRARGHDARLVLVGRDPTPALMAEARSDPRIELTGPVQNVLPYLEQPCIVTLPIAFGGGTRLKIVEAFAVGRPVVSSAKGAEGLDAIDGTHLLLREDPAAMAEAVIELWHRPQWRGALCARALELVQRRYSWPAAARRIARSLGLDAGEASCE